MRNERAEFTLIIDALVTDKGSDAQEILTQALRGVYNYSVNKDKSYWDTLDKDEELDGLLSSQRPELNGKTLLAAIRGFVEEEPDRVQEMLGLKPATTSEPEDLLEPIEPKKKKKVKLREDTKEDWPSGYYQISKAEDIDRIPENTTILHISKPPVLKKANLERILDMAPKIGVVEIPPGLRTTHVHTGIVNLLKERGIELQVRRYREHAYYDEGWITEVQNGKREFFLNAMKNEENLEFFNDLVKYEFTQAEAVEAFFIRDKTTSMSKIARELGLSYRYVVRSVNLLLRNLGYEAVQDKTISSDYLRIKLSSIKEAEQNEVEYNKMRESYKVGYVLPPENLPVQRLEAWQKLYLHFTENPDLIIDLKEEDLRKFDILMYYYNLNGVLDKPLTLEEVGEMHGISGERVRQIRNVLLSRWGLLEEE